VARYEHLPIYKSALDLTVHVEKVVAGMSRYHKYSLGAEMRAGCRSVLQQVVRANNAARGSQRATELLELRERIDALLLTMRVAREVRAFRSFAAYLTAVEQVGSVARQNEGWFRHTQARA
jgi:hypothetical protein